MKVRNFLRVFAGVFIAACVFTSCMTGPDDRVFSSVDESALLRMAELEKLIVSFDAGFTKADLAGARRLIEEMREKPLHDRTFTSRLAAYSGRLFLFEGSRSAAVRELAASRELLPANAAASVLAGRLEADAGKRLSVVEEALKLEPASGELAVERGLAFYELGRYQEAVAAFDTAFGRLEDFYGETYRPLRNTAWDMRGLSSGADGRTASLLSREALTWEEAIELTKTQTGLLVFLTAGRDWPSEEIFFRLVQRSFIPPEQDAGLSEFPVRKPSLKDEVLRCGAAWFLWRLVAENRAEAGLLTRYSSRYRGGRTVQSPIPDIPVESVFFDSVLGCVEREIMSLPDGKRFSPQERLRGAAFHAMLLKAGRR